MFPAIAFITHFPLLGWGRPVQTNTLAYTRKLSRRTGHAIVAAAGPAMNLVMAIFVSLVVLVLAKIGILPPKFAWTLLQALVGLNLLLMVFNLLPIPPLDGGAILAWILPSSMQNVLDFLERYGFIILLLLLLTGQVGTILGPFLALREMWINAVFKLAF